MSRLSGSCPDEPEKGTSFFESEGPLKSLLFMNHLRLSGRLCDARLQVNDRVVMAHRLVLAASSDYFAEVYAGRTEFDTSSTLKLMSEDVDEDLLETLIDFAYTKRVHIDQETVHRLFNAADCLRFTGLKEACFRFLLRTLDTDNCTDMWAFASGHEGMDGGLEEAAFEIVKKNFRDVVKNPSLLQLSVENLETLLLADDLAVLKEEEVFEAAMKWLEHDQSTRGKEVGKIMSWIRLRLMDLDYLMNDVERHPLVQSNQLALDELIKAIEYKEKEVEAGRSTEAKIVHLENDDEEEGTNAGPRRPSVMIEEIHVTKSRDQKLGLGIMGGADRPGHVFRRGDRPGCLVNKIIPGCAAHGTKLRVGDRILSVNGHVLDSLTHSQAVALLTKGREVISLVVQHEDPPAGLKEFTLKTNRGDGFGFSIGGGINSPPATPDLEADSGIFVTHVLAGGAADKSGNVKPGQRVIQVNAIPMHSATHAEALQSMRQSVDCMTLLVCDGYNTDGYAVPRDLSASAKARKRQSLLSRKSMIFDPSDCVAY